MIIGFTGSQIGMTQFQKEELLELLDFKKATEFTFGDCIGSDKEAAGVAFNYGIEVFTIFPPLESKKRGWMFNPSKITNDDDGQFKTYGHNGKVIQVRWFPRDQYLERNRKIVIHSQFMIATPKEYTHTLRSGTWATIRYAWKMKKDITVIPPIVRE